MNQIIGTPLFTVFALVLIAESLKTLFLGTATAYTRGRLKLFLNQEDADWLGGRAVDVEHPTPGRLFRAHRNNLENLLPFIALGGLYAVSGASATAGMVYFIGFFVARAGHTVAYLGKRATLRRNCYSLAWLLLILTGLHGGVAIVGHLL